MVLVPCQAVIRLRWLKTVESRKTLFARITPFLSISSNVARVSDVAARYNYCTLTVRAIWENECNEANQIHASSTTRAETAILHLFQSSWSESATWSRNEVTQTYIFVPLNRFSKYFFNPHSLLEQNLFILLGERQRGTKGVNA